MYYPYPPEEKPENAQPLQNDAMNSISAGDCTGLIPASPDEEELENYAELYSFLPPDSRK